MIKHIPGHGRARCDSHHALPVVDTALDMLAETDFAAFARLKDQPAAMTAHVVYTAVDADAPATVSRTVVGDVIRDRIGFDGLLITDDLSMKALSGTLRERAAQSIDAGCDILLHCNGVISEMRDVAAEAPLLEGAAHRRFEAALAVTRQRDPFDLAAAEAELNRVLQCGTTRLGADPTA